MSESAGKYLIPTRSPPWVELIFGGYILTNKVITTSAKATRAQTKEHNKRLILKSIYNNSPISRADLARATTLTRASISNVVASLLEDQLVQETGLAKNNIGKPATLLTINEGSRHLISLDLANDLELHRIHTLD